jgi:ketol-acid reductoisomerase
VAVLGYGSQGHAHALNLHESGVDVIVGLREGSPSRLAAESAGLRVATPAEAARAAGTVVVLVPDPAQPALYRDAVAPGLEPGDALVFAHGFNVHFGEIEPPDGVDTLMVAPKSPGHMLRREYRAGRGVPALLAVQADPSGEAWALALAYAEAIGSTRAGTLRTTFAEETETDLFGEQAVLCGGLTALMRAGFDTLVEAGYQPEVAYYECVHEMKLIVDLIYEGGLTGMRGGVSDTAEYGDYVAGDRVVGAESRRAMVEILDEVRSGQFARRWIADAGSERFQDMRHAAGEHPVEAVGGRLRGGMAWLGGGA